MEDIKKILEQMKRDEERAEQDYWNAMIVVICVIGAIGSATSCFITWGWRSNVAI